MGVNISEDARHWNGLSQYNPSKVSSMVKHFSTEAAHFLAAEKIWIVDETVTSLVIKRGDKRNH